MEFPKREDFSEQELEGMKKKILEELPEAKGTEFKFVFAGDVNPEDLLPEVREAMEKLKRQIEQTNDRMEKGACADCDMPMEGWPGWDALEKDPECYSLPEGWHVFTGGEGECMGFQCPECSDRSEPGIQAVNIDKL